MLDLKILRNNKEQIEKKLKAKDPSIDLDNVLELDQKLRVIQKDLEDLQSQRNKTSKTIGEKKKKNENISSYMNKMMDINQSIEDLEIDLKKLKEKLNQELSTIPNIPMDDVPISLDPKDNKCIKSHLEKKEFSFPFKNHLELNEKLKLFDFKASAETSGANWPLYTNLGARLEWALINYMLDIHKKNGFIQIMPPLLVKKEIMYGSGQLPKFEDQLFKIKDKDYELYLLPTAEVVLNGMNYNKIIKKESLPLKYVSYTPCFRREAGACGKNERGQKRFYKGWSYIIEICF